MLKLVFVFFVFFQSFSFAIANVSNHNQDSVGDLNASGLDDYLRTYGFDLSPLHSDKNEGYMSNAQRRQFNDRLQVYPSIRYVVEIGLNGGHSAENFFQQCKQIEQFVSFDLNNHPYTAPAVEYFSKKYGSKFSFFPGNSLFTVPEYMKAHPRMKFDLIYIDGSHTYAIAVQDIVNCRKLSHTGTFVWIDDYDYWEVKNAVDGCVSQGVLEVLHVYYSDDPCRSRCWVEARYLF